MSRERPALVEENKQRNRDQLMERHNGLTLADVERARELHRKYRSQLSLTMLCKPGNY